MTLAVEFCDEHLEVPETGPFTIGRQGDLMIDDNPYLHRRFLELVPGDGLWWVRNVGTTLSGTLSDDRARIQSWLPPGAALPLVSSHTMFRFTAGATSYELSFHLDRPPVAPPASVEAVTGTETMGKVTFNTEQLLLILALAEANLRSPGRSAHLPTSAAAARRLGWTISKFNRKLDHICDKLTKAGIRGLHGDSASLASARRARLVEFALSTQLVGPDDIALLDQPHAEADADDE